jgi:hypothetical protein
MDGELFIAADGGGSLALRWRRTSLITTDLIHATDRIDLGMIPELSDQQPAFDRPGARLDQISLHPSAV